MSDLESQTLIQAWRRDLQIVLGEEALDTVDVRVGIFYTAVELTNGDVGVAFTPRDLSDTVCCPRSAAAGPPAGRLAGMSVWDLAEYARSGIPLRRSVGVAALNALSARAMRLYGAPGGRVVLDADALDAAAVREEDAVAMVGAFTPFIKTLKGSVRELWVVDKHPTALRPDEVSLWRPPRRAAFTLSQADVVIITGSALVEGGLDDLLEAASRARCVVLAGPTASPWPATFFARGVDILGGVRITDGPKTMRLVSEGASGYVLFSQVGQKICVIREGWNGETAVVAR